MGLHVNYIHYGFRFESAMIISRSRLGSCLVGGVVIVNWVGYNTYKSSMERGGSVQETLVN